MVVEIQIKGDKELESVLKKAKRAVETGKANLAKEFGMSARNIAHNKAPRGARSPNEALRNAITFKTTRIGKGYMSKVWVKTTNRNNFVAIANEFGVKARRFPIYGGKNPKLAEWVRVKMNRDPDVMRYIIVGGSKSNLGKKNVFWKPTFAEINGKQFKRIVERAYSRRLERALK